MSDWDDDAYDLLDPKHPSYHERMADWGDQLRKAERENPRGVQATEPLPAYCEDFPCCGHEAGDCNGQKYGSDESIKQAVYDRMHEEDDWPMDGEE